MAEQTFSERGYPISVIEQLDQAVIGDAVMVSLLQRHGCVVKKTGILLPTGTVAQEILPRRGWTQQYKLTLPDGFELSWKLDLRHTPAQSLLQVSRQVYEQEGCATSARGNSPVEPAERFLTIRATAPEVIALGMAIHGYQRLLEQQLAVMPEQQEALELVRALHSRFLASLSSSTK